MFWVWKIKQEEELRHSLCLPNQFLRAEAWKETSLFFHHHWIKLFVKICLLDLHKSSCPKNSNPSERETIFTISGSTNLASWWKGSSTCLIFNFYRLRGQQNETVLKSDTFLPQLQVCLGKKYHFHKLKNTNLIKICNEHESNLFNSLMREPGRW